MAADACWELIPTVILLQIFRYLCPKDRIQASECCRHWRPCLYHVNLWPAPVICFNLLSISEPQNAILSSFNVNDTIRTDNSLRKSKKYLWPLLSKAARCLQDVTIKFDPSSIDNINELVQLLKVLRDNSVSEDLRASNLKCLSLRPTSVFSLKDLRTYRKDEVLVNRTVNLNDLVKRLWEPLEGLLLNSKGLQHLTLGGIEELLNRTPRMLAALSQKESHSSTLQSLHLASIKEDPDFYAVPDLEPRLLAPFSNLKALSIDFDHVNDELLLVLSQKKLLQELIINVHGIDDFHPGISKSSWNSISHIEGLEVTVNVLHTEESAMTLQHTIFESSIPLTVLRLYFTNMSSESEEETLLFMNSIAAYHHETLKSLVLVDYLSDELMPNSLFSSAVENPLVMLAWRCKLLERLVLIGFEIADIDLIAIARLRGEHLTELLVPSCCISLTSSCNSDSHMIDEDLTYHDMVSNSIKTQLVEDISKPLNRAWKPLEISNFPKRCTDGSCLSSTYIFEILNDQSNKLVDC